MNRSNVDEIKARLSIEEVVGQYVKLEKAGRSFKAKCPFHNEKTASFFVSPERGGYYCFGCGAKGDVFSFVEQFEGLDFKGALKVLADKAGIRLSYDSKADGERDRMFAVMEEAAAYFEAQLSLSTEARDYLSRRGVKDATRSEFRIGWAPEGWRNLYAHLRSRKYPDDLMEKAGLAKRTDQPSGGLAAADSRYDRFRGRIMFPLCDSSGRVIAFSGRILPRLDDGKAGKYLNSPDTPLFDKSSVLYGLNMAKSFIRRLDYSILVEGQMDLIMSHQAGVKNAVAASGVALTEERADKNGAVNNLGLLRRLSGNVIIAFDSDAAGRKAAMKAAWTALGLGMDVKIADIAGGKDPADLVLASPEAWKDSLRKAKPIVEFELGNVLRETTDPRKVPKALRERVLPVVAVIENATDRAYAIKSIADKTGLPEQALGDDLVAVEKKLALGSNGSGKEDGSAAPANPHAFPAPDPSHLDLVERRMMGLLDLMERAGAPKAAEYRSMIAIAAQGRFEQMLERAKSVMGDISFEAETVYGREPERWNVHMDELVSNFEEDLVNSDLVSAMAGLRVAERAGDQAGVADLAEKCKALSVRKAELSRRRTRK